MMSLRSTELAIFTVAVQSQASTMTTARGHELRAGACGARREPSRPAAIDAPDVEAGEALTLFVPGSLVI
jgi:hypothetical protein